MTNDEARTGDTSRDARGRAESLRFRLFFAVILSASFTSIEGSRAFRQSAVGQWMVIAPE